MLLAIVARRVVVSSNAANAYAVKGMLSTSSDGYVNLGRNISTASDPVAIVLFGPHASGVEYEMIVDIRLIHLRSISIILNAVRDAAISVVLFMRHKL